MASSITETYVIVAAIDFGTTYSGYAFSMKTDPTRIFMNKDWGATELKTPTSILLDSKAKFKAFGYLAESEFAEDASKTEHSVHLFQHFKMELHKLEKLSKEILVTSKDGKSVATAFDLVSMALKCMKDSLLSAVAKQGLDVRASDIRWVVTVPAIWSDVSKRFMREAAYEAKLISDVNSSQLLIALEPEAGAFYCRSVDADNMAFETSDTSKTLPKGSKYIVVDAGGGTIDIAVHQVTGPKTSKELFYATGGGWGGNRVNQAFENLMAKVVGKDMIELYKSKCPYAWWEYIQKFETMKRAWIGNKPLMLPVSHMLSHTYEESRGEPLEEAFKRKKNLGVVFRNGHIRCAANAMTSVFDEAVQLTIKHLRDMMKRKEMKGVGTMMLVGGFAESPYLRKAIKDEFESKMSILIPQQASIAVVKGAVLFGHNPAIVEERCLARTYGTGINIIFDPKIHDEPKKFEAEDKYYCGNIFSSFVKKGEYVKAGATRQFRYYPLRSTDTAVQFVLYNADKDDVKYTDEDKVEAITKKSLPMPDTSKGKDRPIDVEVTFGHTEIKVKATDVNKGKAITMEGDLHFAH